MTSTEAAAAAHNQVAITVNRELRFGGWGAGEDEGVIVLFATFAVGAGAAAGAGVGVLDGSLKLGAAVCTGLNSSRSSAPISTSTSAASKVFG